MFDTLLNLIALRHACDAISLGSMRGANVHSLEPCLCDGAWLALPLGVGVYLAARMYTLYSWACRIMNSMYLVGFA